MPNKPPCRHLPATDTGKGYVHCPECNGYWNEEEWAHLQLITAPMNGFIKGFLIGIIASTLLYIVAIIYIGEYNPDYWTEGERFFVGLTGLLCLIVGPVVGWVVKK